MVYDVIIIGVGPAGLSAGIYAKRAGLKALIFADKYSVSSQICNTYEVCNYLGFNKISGQELYDSFKRHASEFGIEIKEEKVIELKNINHDIKKVLTKNGEYSTKSIVVATGGIPKKGGFEKEENFVGNGISYCATCDGNFFKDKEVAVIGGGDVAAEDAIYLSKICKKVYMIVRKSSLRATQILQEEIKTKNNIEIIYDSAVKEVLGNEKVQGILYKNKNDIIMSELSVDGIFVGIGMMPSNELLKGKVDMVGEYIKADETCKTSVPGIFVAGDIRKKQLRQVVTAASDGANAITSVQKYLNEKVLKK